jgi:uncharacterized protein (DUF2252 family)
MWSTLIELKLVMLENQAPGATLDNRLIHSEAVLHGCKPNLPSSLPASQARWRRAFPHFTEDWRVSMSDELVPETGDPRALEVCSAINEWNQSLSVEDRKDKYDLMAASPFAFYRGTNHLFWADLAGDTRLTQFGDYGTRTWLQGDLHTDNFGAFGNDEGEVVYDVNDFDESVIADYQYDLWRMAVSLVLVAQENGGFSHKKQANVIKAFAASYLQTLSSYLGNNSEYETIFTPDNTYGRLNNFLEGCEKQSRRSTMLEKWTREKDGSRHFHPPEPDEKLGELKITDPRRTEILEAMEAYESDLWKKPEGHHGDYFRIKDIARRLKAGIGSLGVPRYYVLIEGETDSPDDDRILDVKHQSKPTAYYYLSEPDQIEYFQFRSQFPGEEAKWHEAAYRALARHTDDHLGWMELSDGFYSVRERSFFKETFRTEKLTTKTRFTKLAEQWGMVLATDHSRRVPGRRRPRSKETSHRSHQKSPR